MSSSEQRMRDTLKSPYPDDEEGWDGLIKMGASELDEYDSSIQNAEDNQFIDTANEGALEKIASVFDIERRTDETVPEFRARLKVALQAQITSSTVNEIQQVAATILDTGIENVQVREPDSETAFFRIAVDTDQVDVPVSPAILSDIMSEVSAAGVNVGVNIFVGEGGIMQLRGVATTSTTLNNAGLSSQNLDQLSTGGWTLSRQ